VQTCYSKWLSICSAYCEFMLYFMCVEWNCPYFFLFHLSYSCLFLCCLLVLPYYMVNKDEYISNAVIISQRVHTGPIFFFLNDTFCCLCVCSLPAANPCESNGCSHLCVATLNHYRCLCPFGMRMDSDGRNCVAGV